MIEVTLKGQRISSKRSNSRQYGRRQLLKPDGPSEQKSDLAMTVFYIAVIILALTNIKVTLVVVSLTMIYNYLKNRKD